MLQSPVIPSGVELQALFTTEKYLQVPSHGSLVCDVIKDRVFVDVIKWKQGCPGLGWVFLNPVTHA